MNSRQAGAKTPPDSGWVPRGIDLHLSSPACGVHMHDAFA